MCFRILKQQRSLKTDSNPNLSTLCKKCVCVVFYRQQNIMVKSNVLIVQKTLESTYIESDCLRKSQRGQNVSIKSKELEKWRVFLAEAHIESKGNVVVFTVESFESQELKNN